MNLKKLAINTLSCLDYISPAAAILETAAHGGGLGSWQFAFSFNDVTTAGFSPFHIIALLADCEPWGYCLQADTITLSVPMEYASQAQYLLDRAGVPVQPQGAYR